jgi:hypothetical protein
MTGSTRIRVELLDVHCNDTEDWTGADTLYVAGAAVRSDGQGGTPVLVPPIWINDGETKQFPYPQHVPFDGMVPNDQYLILALDVWDEDASRDWTRNKEWIDDIQKVLPGLVGVIAGICSGSVSASVGAAGTAKAILPPVRDALDTLIAKDVDDNLGTLSVAIPPQGATTEYLTWSFSHTPTRWWDPNDTSWNYLATYQVTRHPQRLLVHAEPATVTRNVPTEVRVLAADADTYQPVGGEVLIAGADKGPTGQPFEIDTDQTVNGLVQADGYVDTTFSIPARGKALTATSQPHPPPLLTPVEVIIHASDPNTNQPVVGRVIISGAEVGRTDELFTYTFRRHVLPREMGIVYPQGTVIPDDPTYDSATIGFGFPDDGF